MGLTINRFGGHIAGFCLLCYITKVQLFHCDGDSVKGCLKCESNECCTPPLKNVTKADITGTSNGCLIGYLYDLKNKKPNQKCVSVKWPCDVELSYCYIEESSTFFLTTSSEVSGFTDCPVAYTTRNTVNSEEAAETNTQTGFLEIEKKRRKQSTANPSNTVVKLSDADYAGKQSTANPSNTVVTFSDTDYAGSRCCGNSHERSEHISSTTLAPHGISVDTTYANINQSNRSFEKGLNYKSVPLENSDYSYANANNTDNNHMYITVYDETKSSDDNYIHAIQFPDREDTYECT